MQKVRHLFYKKAKMVNQYSQIDYGESKLPYNRIFLYGCPTLDDWLKEVLQFSFDNNYRAHLGDRSKLFEDYQVKLLICSCPYFYHCIQEINKFDGCVYIPEKQYYIPVHLKAVGLVNYDYRQKMSIQNRKARSDVKAQALGGWGWYLWQKSQNEFVLKIQKNIYEQRQQGLQFEDIDEFNTYKINDINVLSFALEKADMYFKNILEYYEKAGLTFKSLEEFNQYNHNELAQDCGYIEKSKTITKGKSQRRCGFKESLFFQVFQKHFSQITYKGKKYEAYKSDYNCGSMDFYVNIEGRCINFDCNAFQIFLGSFTDTYKWAKKQKDEIGNIRIMYQFEEEYSGDITALGCTVLDLSNRHHFYYYKDISNDETTNKSEYLKRLVIHKYQFNSENEFYEAFMELLNAEVKKFMESPFEFIEETDQENTNEQIDTELIEDDLSNLSSYNGSYVRGYDEQKRQWFIENRFNLAYESLEDRNNAQNEAWSNLSQQEKDEFQTIADQKILLTQISNELYGKLKEILDKNPRCTFDQYQRAKYLLEDSITFYHENYTKKHQPQCSNNWANYNRIIWAENDNDPNNKNERYFEYKKNLTQQEVEIWKQKYAEAVIIKKKWLEEQAEQENTISTLVKELQKDWDYRVNFTDNEKEEVMEEEKQDVNSNIEEEF